MQAVRYEQFGEPAEVLSVQEIPVPEPGPGQVRVRVLASPINPSDLMTIRGEYGRLPELPATPGFEGVGLVEASGGGLLARLRRNRRVAILGSLTGNWAEQAIVPAKQVVPVPAALPIEQAATFFINPVTAWAMTQRVLRIPPGGWLLQTASGSQLGRMVIRLGRQLGFRTINVVRRDEQIEELTRLGGDAVFAFDVAEQAAGGLASMVREITGEGGVQWAIDPVGGELGSAVVDCLAQGGRMLVFGTLADQPLTFSPRSLMTPGASVEGFWLARWLAKQSLMSKLKMIRAVVRLVRAGVLVSEIGETFPLERVVDAVNASEQPGRNGKVLLEIGSAAS